MGRWFPVSTNACSVLESEFHWTSQTSGSVAGRSVVARKQVAAAGIFAAV